MERQRVIEHCHEILPAPDFVMEPQVFDTLREYIESGGDRNTVANMLAENYSATGQMCNVLGNWLADLEGDRISVDECFESTLSSLLSKHFRPTLADKIFVTERGIQGIEWLPELITHKSWRRLVYSLAEIYPNCLMLTFAVKLISDAGYQHEICNVNTAAQQLEIFSRVLISSIDSVLAEHNRGPLTESYDKAFAELTRVVCHSEHTYLYAQTLLHVLSKEEKGIAAAACAHLSESLRMVAHEREQGTSALHVALLQSHDQHIVQNLILAMHTMLSKNCLNPADITQLYQHYVSANPPPIELIREPLFLNMLIDSLFAYDGVKVHIDHRPKYVYLLAYASCVCERKRNSQRIQSRIELDSTRDSIERIVTLLEYRDDLSKKVKPLLNGIRLPVVATGLLHYLKGSMLSDEVTSEPETSHFVLLDHIASSHSNLQLSVFQAICELYDRQSSLNEVAELIMEKQRVLIDRFVNLLSVGQPLAVIEKINRMFKEGQIDISLVRYFASQVLEIIAPPYSQEFIDVFLPIVSNRDIFDSNNPEKTANAKEFINFCTRSSANKIS